MPNDDVLQSQLIDIIKHHASRPITLEMLHYLKKDLNDCLQSHVRTPQNPNGRFAKHPWDSFSGVAWINQGLRWILTGYSDSDNYPLLVFSAESKYD